MDGVAESPLPPQAPERRATQQMTVVTSNRLLRFTVCLPSVLKVARQWNERVADVARCFLLEVVAGSAGRDFLRDSATPMAKLAAQ